MVEIEETTEITTIDSVKGIVDIPYSKFRIRYENSYQEGRGEAGVTDIPLQCSKKSWPNFSIQCSSKTCHRIIT